MNKGDVYGQCCGIIGTCICVVQCRVRFLVRGCGGSNGEKVSDHFLSGTVKSIRQDIRQEPSFQVPAQVEHQQVIKSSIPLLISYSSLDLDLYQIRSE